MGVMFLGPTFSCATQHDTGDGGGYRLFNRRSTTIVRLYDLFNFSDRWFPVLKVPLLGHAAGGVPFETHPTYTYTQPVLMETRSTSVYTIRLPNAMHGMGRRKIVRRENQRVYYEKRGLEELRKRLELDLDKGRERVLHVAYCYYLYIFTCTDDETKMIPQ